MIGAYDLDHLYTYRTERVPAGLDHPNPEYTSLRTPYFCEVAVTPGAGAGAGSAGVELTGAGWPTRR